jgi:hypothetical protein
MELQIHIGHNYNQLFSAILEISHQLENEPVVEKIIWEGANGCHQTSGVAQRRQVSFVLFRKTIPPKPTPRIIEGYILSYRRYGA